MHRAKRIPNRREDQHTDVVAQRSFGAKGPTRRLVSPQCSEDRVGCRPCQACSWPCFLPVRSWLGQDSDGGSQKWSHSRHIWKREPIGFAYIWECVEEPCGPLT